MKLLCKKSFNMPGVFTLHQGRYYLVKNIDNRFIIPAEWRPMDKIVENDDEHWWFFSSFTGRPFYVWDYFYTPQEERKMKLEKIELL